jgi:hypothetical protein
LRLPASHRRRISRSRSPGSIDGRPGVDDLEAAVVPRERAGVAAHGDPARGVELRAVAQDRAVERLGRRAVELPDDVVAPVQAVEHLVERWDARADPLVGAAAVKHRCAVRPREGGARLQPRPRRASGLTALLQT